jgi:prepilin-type N-terminal cleavage/methylation domain-containing protein
MRRRTGLTLLELVVALAVVALAATLSVPMLRQPAAAEDLDALVARARHAAVTRGETLRLTLAPDGRWRVVSLRAPERAVLEGAGVSSGALTMLDFSPLGTCVPAVGSGPAWDPVRCAVAR